MALSDLELLSLVERAQQGNKGERGAQGVGIRSIEQNGNESFTITLTDGSSKEIRYPIPEPGPAGPPGQPGKDGSSSTVAGPKGIQGEQGRAGTNGRDGKDGTFIDSALVDANGQLLLGLSDGQIINVGKVTGPAGLAGERGPVGLPGPSGMDGTNFLAGPRAPSDVEDGKDGDMWLDTSSPEFNLYGPKRSGAWGGRIAFLKQPQIQQNRPTQSLPIGGGSSGPSTTFGSSFPKKRIIGHQHVMSDTFYEYVWTGGAWIQVVSPSGDVGSTTLGGLADVTLTNTQEGQVLAATDSGTWENSSTIDGDPYS